jgi:hypothetical protein
MFPCVWDLLQGECTPYYSKTHLTFSETCIVLYIYVCVCVCVCVGVRARARVCVQDQQNAHFISFICFSYIILYMFRTKTFINLLFMFPCIVTQYTKMTNKIQLCRIIYYSWAAVHVSNDIFAHHQEHRNCITASGITHVYRCRLVPAGSDIRV